MNEDIKNFKAKVKHRIQIKFYNKNSVYIGKIDLNKGTILICSHYEKNMYMCWYKNTQLMFTIDEIKFHMEVQAHE